MACFDAGTRSRNSSSSSTASKGPFLLNQGIAQVNGQDFMITVQSIGLLIVMQLSIGIPQSLGSPPQQMVGHPVVRLLCQSTE